MRRLTRSYAAIILALLACTLTWADPANLLKNPGFELVGEEGQIEGWAMAPEAAGGVASVTEAAQVRSGERAAQLTATEQEGAHAGVLLSPHARAQVGRRYGLSVWCSGSGSIQLGAIQHFRLRSGKPPSQEDWQEQPATLTDAWQELRFEVSTTNADLTRVAMLVRVEGEGATACLDDASLVVSAQIAVVPQYAMVKRGDTFTFAVTALREGNATNAGSLQVTTKTSAGTTEQELAIEGGGVTRYPFTAAPALEAEDGLVQLDFSSQELGASARAFLHMVDEETYGKFAEAAARTRIALPAHLLFLGDSLSDVHRDHNYTDEVAFWLWQAHDGQVTYRNAGVGGDFITRTWSRLIGEPTAYRLEMFDDLYEPKPTRVFIFLGHNDTKLKPEPEFKSPDDYQDPVVSREDYERYHKMAIERIREATGAEFTLISNTSSVYEVCAQRVINNLAAGKSGGSLFGKPEVMEQFNEILRKVAQDTGSSYADVYTPTRDYPDKPSLFLADGVHLNAQGNFLVALEILKQLGE